eukprot:m.1521139 g.1521139  ORF g.1521139 m.1521139 type:complete len:777 (+) comp25229_c0_seq14:504-2834(+)
MYSSVEWNHLRAQMNLQKDTIRSVQYMRSCIGQMKAILQKCKRSRDKFDASVQNSLWSSCRRTLQRFSRTAQHRRIDIDVSAVVSSEDYVTWSDAVERCNAAVKDAMAHEPKKQFEAANFGYFNSQLSAKVNDWMKTIRDTSGKQWAANFSDTDSNAPGDCPEGSQLAAIRERLDMERFPEDLSMVVQSGSFMYNLHTHASDADYTVVFTTHTQALVDHRRPRTTFENHVAMPMGSDKRGEVEYTGKEVGTFLLELAKGNPSNVELLFTDPGNSVYESHDWSTLRCIRHVFVTERCINQYFGFIKDRLKRAERLLDDLEKDDSDTTLSCETFQSAFSKLLYHAYHKMFDLRRIVSGNDPLVRLDTASAERRFIMNIRQTRPLLGDFAPDVLLRNANEQLHQISEQRRSRPPSLLRPAEVDVATAMYWLEGVRRRHLKTSVMSTPSRTATPVRTRTSSASENKREQPFLAHKPNVLDRLRQFEQEENVKIVYAAECSSRILGTSHAASDHDICAIFVHPTDRYFSMLGSVDKLRKTYPATDATAETDITGWECRHAFSLLASDNITLLETFTSPLVYVAHYSLKEDVIPGAVAPPEWVDSVRMLAKEHYGRGSLAWAAWSHASQNYSDYVTRAEPGEILKKKYIHVSRKILLVHWLVYNLGIPTAWPPPLRVLDLLAALPDTQADGALHIGPEVRAELTDALDISHRSQLAERGDNWALLDSWIVPQLTAIKGMLSRVFSTGRQAKTKKASPAQGGSSKDAAWDAVLVPLIKSASVF